MHAVVLQTKRIASHTIKVWAVTASEQNRQSFAKLEIIVKLTAFSQL